LNPLDQPATVERLHRLAAQGLLSPDALDRAVALVKPVPAQVSRTRIELALVIVGGPALMSIVVSQGEGLRRLALLAAMGAVVLLVAAYGLLRGLDRPQGRAALAVAGALAGVPLLAAGQIYQPEAVQLLPAVAWVALLLTLALLSGSVALQVLLMGVLNATLFLAWNGQPSLFSLSAAAVTLWAVNGAWLVATSLPRLRRGGRPHWQRRVALAMTTVAGTAVLVFLPFKLVASGAVINLLTDVLAPAAVIVAGVFLVHQYRRREPDPVALTLMTACATLTATTMPLGLMFGLNFCTVPLLAMLVMLQLATAVLLLRRAARKGAAR
jgi:hypothetical protein